MRTVQLELLRPGEILAERERCSIVYLPVGPLPRGTAPPAQKAAPDQFGPGLLYFCGRGTQRSSGWRRTLPRSTMVTGRRLTDSYGLPSMIRQSTLTARRPSSSFWKVTVVSGGSI